MPIVDLQRGIAEAGRIRIGQQVPMGNGRTRPEKLLTFRLTSPDRVRIEQAAGLFGGKVEAWKAPAGPQWEVITETAAIDVIVPPTAMAFSQWLELWSAGGCQRRCDGQTELLTEEPCLCDPQARECEFHTRLSVMIRDLPGLALWRLDTQGWYAARELAGAVEIMMLAAGRGLLLPARLLLEQRSVKRPGPDGKVQTLRFAVPRLDPGITPGELVAGQVAALSLPALADGQGPELEPRRLTPVPQIEGPRPTIAEQSAPPPQRPPRANAAPAIPASGRRRAAGGNTRTPPTAGAAQEEALHAPPDGGSRTTAAQETGQVEPTPAEQQSRTGKAPGDPGYWRARTFADAAERGIEDNQLRGLAAMRAGKVEGDQFSMSSLGEDGWEAMHKIVLGFPLRHEDAEYSQALDDQDSEDRAQAANAAAGAPDSAQGGREAAHGAGAPPQAAAPATAGLTRPQLLEALEAAGIDTDYARAFATKLFGTDHLTPGQRTTLLRELTAEAAEAAL